MDDQLLNGAINALKKGQCIVYPTDSLYGLGADIFQHKAVKKVYTLKKRPAHLALPVAVANIDQMKKIAVINDLAGHLIDAFLPGPLTLIMNKKKIVPPIVTGGKDTIGIRIPNDPIALLLLTHYGPLTTTSANIHKQETPTTVSAIHDMFKSKHITVYIDDGMRNKLPSTIIDVSTGSLEVVREGRLSIDTIKQVASTL